MAENITEKTTQTIQTLVHDAFDTNESIKWLEIKNESLYDYLKKEGNYILNFIFDYFGRA